MYSRCEQPQRVTHKSRAISSSLCQKNKPSFFFVWKYEQFDPNSWSLWVSSCSEIHISKNIPVMDDCSHIVWQIPLGQKYIIPNRVIDRDIMIVDFNYSGCIDPYLIWCESF